jgi:hypothetical protein
LRPWRATRSTIHGRRRRARSGGRESLRCAARE